MSAREYILASLGRGPKAPQALVGELVGQHYTEDGARAMVDHWSALMIDRGEVELLSCDGARVLRLTAKQAPTERIVKTKTANDRWKEAIKRHGK